MCRHAEHDGVLAIGRVVLEELDEFESVIERVLSMIVEAQAPHDDDGMAVVMQIRRVFGDLHAVAEELPVVDHFVDRIRAESRQVVHHGIRAAIGVGPFATMIQDRVELPQAGIVEGFGDEALHEDAVDAVVPHPFEMAKNGLAILRRVKIRGRAVGMFECRLTFLIRAEFRHVRPEIELAIAGGEVAGEDPVVPAAAEGVAGGGVPTLVPGEDFVGHGGGVDAVNDRAGVGVEGFGEDFFAARLGAEEGGEEENEKCKVKNEE